MKAIPLPEMVSKAFYEHWVCRFGVPARIITDQGRQFEAQLFRNLAAICGAKVQHTTPYHPQSNGKTERFHRILKAAIIAHNNVKWTESLPTVLLGLRSAIRDDTNNSIEDMVYGTNLRLPGELFVEPSSKLYPETFVGKLQSYMNNLKPIKTQHPTSQKIFVHKDLKSSSHVFVRIDRVKKSLEPAYEGPFPVLTRQDKYFTVTIKGKNVNISVDTTKARIHVKGR
ncbi:hypothetical protein AVEN_26198-1 [Araneus ventricosus]|uniref:Integrase catalytic domain-containing protein n=1 Tax=Araneus ventricosus TaxID=182803 RepID=A0A4Y2QLV3_ARAVE|nr:hypothetical protein AVEN_225628-1 [Araneus ventricosus]GBN64319.1 hypothetical protein AVEN_26198-1 [Araneus ventricosus]